MHQQTSGASCGKAPISFVGQSDFLARIPTIIEIAAHYGLDVAKWREYEVKARDFRVKVPVIGAFSAGKTSLLNALLGENLLSVEVTPETAIAARIAAAPQFSANLVHADGRRFVISADDLCHNRWEAHGDTAHIEVGHPAFTPWPRLQVVDLPGWGSGVDAHERVIDAHAVHSLAYVLVVSVDDGSLRESLVRASVELAALDMPILLVINKIDKRTAQDVADVTQQIVKAVEERGGRAPLAVIPASARKRDIASLKAAFDVLETRADERFTAGVIVPAAAELQGLSQHLDILASLRFANREALEAEKESLQAEIAGFARQLAIETQKLRQRIAPVQDILRRRLLDSLGAQLERYTGLAESGSDIRNALLFDARAMVAETLRKEFDPAVSRYLDALEQALPQKLPLSLPMDLPKKSARQDSEVSAALAALLAAVTPILSNHPIGRIVAVILPVLAQLFESSREQQMQAVEKARTREHLRQQIRAAIERAVEDLVLSLGPQLDTCVAEAERVVAERVQAECAERERVLAQLEVRIAAGEASAAEGRARAAQDKQVIDQHLAALRGRIRGESRQSPN